MQRAGSRLRRILGALEGIWLDPIALQLLQDVTGALEDGANRPLVRLE